MLTLYYAPGACSMAPHIVLEEIGAPYEAVKIDLKMGEQKTAAYAAINPRRHVPALKLDDGQVLTEDIAVLAYLASTVPERNLLPADMLPRARVLEWMSFLATGPHVSYGTFLHPETHVADPGCAPSAKANAETRMQEGFADIESHLRQPFIVGNSFSIADAHLFVFYCWGRWRRLVDDMRTPKLQAWGAAMRVRPSVQRMVAAEGIHIR